jgi:hypothetical protein
MKRIDLIRQFEERGYVLFGMADVMIGIRTLKRDPASQSLGIEK